MSTNYTLTYSEGAKGWPSFYSYYPEWILAMNQYLYTFKGGNLWKHNVNEARNNYYGVQGVSTITGVFNQEPTTQKLFKTIEIETDDPWNCTLTSDLGSGYMDADFFELKEGSYFSYIRRQANNDNFSLRSTQGIGSIINTSVNGTSVTLSFGFKVGSMISIGDVAFHKLGASVVEIGPITSISENRKSITITGENIPDGSYVLYIKNSVAESYGTLGYYLQFTLQNSSTTAVELFNIDAEVFKSAP